MLMSIILSIACLMRRANPRENRTQHTNILHSKMAFTSWMSSDIKELNLRHKTSDLSQYR